jgi:transposase-like protein
MSIETEIIPAIRWTAKRKAALVISMLKGQITPASVAREHDLPLSEVECWMEEAVVGMENALKAKPRDLRAEYEAKIMEMTSAYGEAMLQIKALKKLQALLDETES